MFEDRREAGRALATALERFRGRPDVLVLALPRGGVPVAAEVARALGAPLDVFLVRKLGVPDQPELAFGAIAEGGVRVYNWFGQEPPPADFPRAAPAIPGLTAAGIERIAAREQDELDRQQRHYRHGRRAPDVRGRVVIVIDDGLATGATMEAAAVALKQRQAARVVVAVPVAAPEACERMARVADEVVCLSQPEPLHAVGMAYRDFSQTTDEEVADLLAAGTRAAPTYPNGF